MDIYQSLEVQYSAKGRFPFVIENRPSLAEIPTQIKMFVGFSFVVVKFSRGNIGRWLIFNDFYWEYSFNPTGLELNKKISCLT